MFTSSGQWSVDSLAHLLKAHPRFVRKNLGFWVSQGLLKELSSDVYGLIQEQKFISKVPVTRKLTCTKLETLFKVKSVVLMGCRSI